MKTKRFFSVAIVMLLCSLLLMEPISASAASSTKLNSKDMRVTPFPFHMPENMKISKPYIDKQLAEVLAQQEQIQRNSSRVATDLARLSVFKGNLREMEAQQRADDLPHASIVVIHIGPGLIEVIILRQNRLRVHHRGVIVNEALEINIQLLCNIVQGLNINGNGPVFVF